ncbi:hypothetical protein Tco_1425574 [Tanacetum coccineum]
MKQIPATDTANAREQTKDDLVGNDLKQYDVNIEAMNLILLFIPNDIHNFVDACENAKDMWDRVKRLMHGTELSQIEKESQSINEYYKFTSIPGESISYVFNHFSQLINDLDRNNIKPIRMAINTKNVNASRAKRAAKTHDPLALDANTYALSLSSRSPTTYYVTHPPSVVDYDDDYQGDTICEDQEDSLTIAMMFLLLCNLIEWIFKAEMMGMIVDMQEGQLLRKENLLRMGMVRRILDKEMLGEFYEPRINREMLLMFSAIIAMPKNDFLRADAFKIKILKI